MVKPKATLPVSRDRRTEQTGLLSIGQLATTAGVSTRTIRYYEELGILPEPSRTAAGTRKYSQDWRFYLESALMLKDLGFSLEEIRLIGRLALGETTGRDDRDNATKVVSARMRSLEHRIHVLTRLRDILHKIESGEDPGSPPDRIAELLSAGILDDGDGFNGGRLRPRRGTAEPSVGR